MDLPHRPRRRFGQHFLTQARIAERIVALAQLSGREVVLEIGPGRGALTSLLAAAARELWLVEIDRELSAALRERYAGNPAVHLIEGDALAIDLGERLRPHAPVVVVANLPYNIATPLLMGLIERPDVFGRLVLMLQREVASRLSATPGTKAYGALSVMFQLQASVRSSFTVGPAAFTPRPKVDSAVVLIEPRRPAGITGEELHEVRQVVRAAFSQRRKQLGNALAVLASDAAGALGRAGVDRRRRPETLTPREFVAVTRAIHA
jgi:16S rRNA (adenine1518-N6/adenine1519-N6)-dimethyltransferase